MTRKPNEIESLHIDAIHSFFRLYSVTDTEILDWLNRHSGREKQFWYGQRTIREAVGLAMIRNIGWNPTDRITSE